MQFKELTGEQTRRLIDSEQRFSTYRDTLRKLRHSYRGSMQWKTVKGRAYLYNTVDSVSTSLGPRTSETEQIKSAFDSGRERLRERRDNLSSKIESEARVDRAMGLGRVPVNVADILRRLDRIGILGKGITVVGTNAIYVYERMAGGQFDSGLLATGDVDLLFDGRRRLRLIGPDQPIDGLAGLLKQADKSFELVAPGAFRASNDQGFMVDLIQPSQPVVGGPRSALGGANDLHAAEIEGLAWLQNVAQVERILLDEKAVPFVMTAPDPRAFALHKLWLSEQPDRDPAKSRRDLRQARAVAQLVDLYLGEKSFDDPGLSGLPKSLRDRAEELTILSRLPGRTNPNERF